MGVPTAVRTPPKARYSASHTFALNAPVAKTGRAEGAVRM
jgi:hypothetical protein